MEDPEVPDCGSPDLVPGGATSFDHQSSGFLNSGMKLLYYRSTDSFWPGLPGVLVITDSWLVVLFGHITAATSIAPQLSGSHIQIPWTVLATPLLSRTQASYVATSILPMSLMRHPASLLHAFSPSSGHALTRIQNLSQAGHEVVTASDHHTSATL